ncbi:hypothetical protein BD289DRAFT_278915 [Coniella lustricola]|uniref:Uncharacterized protein n=1 Tax=Coniella lustricola TaxID=2025994 RepID=A0A2T3A661_9PEZI|nr:hypothetical protein BD289DRAFT_278915 [Coniella lustricola]
MLAAEREDEEKQRKRGRDTCSVAHNLDRCSGDTLRRGAVKKKSKPARVIKIEKSPKKHSRLLAISNPLLLIMMVGMRDPHEGTKERQGSRPVTENLFLALLGLCYSGALDGNKSYRRSSGSRPRQPEPEQSDRGLSTCLLCMRCDWTNASDWACEQLCKPKPGAKQTSRSGHRQLLYVRLREVGGFGQQVRRPSGTSQPGRQPPI